MLSTSNEIILKPEDKLRNPLVDITKYKLLEDKPEKVYNPQEYYPGTIIRTREGYVVEILEYINKYEVVIRFLYNGYIMKCRMSSFIVGAIKNPFHINSRNGYFGVGPYGKHSHMKIYQAWSSMLSRLDPEWQERNSRNASYVTCSLCKDWHNYQLFALWYDTYWKSLNQDIEYQLDKDILQWNQKYKVYGPYTCCLVPEEINICFSNLNSGNETGLPLGVRPNGNKFTASIKGVNQQMIYIGTFDTAMEAFEAYKAEKKKIIASLAEKYFSINAITQQVYEALLNIEILPYPV